MTFGAPRVAALVLLFGLIYFAGPVLLLGFAGVLAGIFLQSLALFVTRWTHLSHGLALALVVILLFALAAGAMMRAGPALAGQLDVLIEEIPPSLRAIEDKLVEYRWGRDLLQRSPKLRKVLDSGAGTRTTSSPARSSRETGPSTSSATTGSSPPGHRAIQAAAHPTSTVRTKGTTSESGAAVAAVAESLPREVTARFASGAGGLLSVAFEGLGAFFVLFFIGLYMAADPECYAGGVVRLWPEEKRPRIRKVLQAITERLRGWLKGTALSMAIVGFLTTTGLWLLGVPIALMFGAMAALAEFIPNIGPVLSMAPALLVSFGKSASLAGWVFLVYLGIQLLESYVIFPIVQQRETHVPAPLLIFCQVLLGYLGGGLGLILAAPLTASVLVLVRMLYLEDVLGEPEARKS